MIFLNVYVAQIYVKLYSLFHLVRSRSGLRSRSSLVSLLSSPFSQHSLWRVDENVGTTPNRPSHKKSRKKLVWSSHQKSPRIFWSLLDTVVLRRTILIKSDVYNITETDFSLGEIKKLLKFLITCLFCVE